MVHTFPRAISRQKRCQNFCRSQPPKNPEASLRLNKKGGGVGSRLKARLGCNQIEEYQMAGDNSNHLQKHLTNEMV